MLSSRDIFLRKFHEIVPLRFFAGRIIRLSVQSVEAKEEEGEEGGEGEDETLGKNQEMLNPETELKALFRDSSSVLLQGTVDEDGAVRESRARMTRVAWRDGASIFLRWASLS